MTTLTYDAAATLAAATLPEPDVTPHVGAKVVFHGYFGDYEAEVVAVSPATRYVPERYHLKVSVGDDLLTWVQAWEEQITMVLSAEAAGVG